MKKETGYPGTDGWENPFAAVGHPVYGKNHVGRLGDTEVLRQRILQPSAVAGATAIVGPPRIGKSSLAYHMLMRPEVREQYPQLLPVWINVRTQESSERLLRKLVDELWTMIEESGADIVDAPLSRRRERVLDSTRDWAELQDDTQQFLKLIRRRGWKAVLILDEFDSAREVFKARPGTFQALREIASNPEWSIGLVTTSRRELREIVDRADPVESTFPGIFREIYVRCFDSREIAELVDRAPGASTSPWLAPFLAKLNRITGGHPYLASMLLDRLCTLAPVDPLVPESIDVAISDMRPALQHYYNDLEALLRADGRFLSLLEVLMGPQITATQEDAERLLYQGLIRADGTRYRAFSDDFEDYLALVGRQSDYWSSWVAVETLLRSFVSGTLTDELGADWLNKVRKQRPKLVSLLDSWEMTRDREISSFGDRASREILDYTYPHDLYALIASYWEYFGKLLGRDKKYWNDRFEILSKVRNPMAHNRMSVITSAERGLFHAYCDEIQELLTPIHR
ncbi:Swt1 family HEPN domain-containing protein [Actinacidiphila soli]|uniref:Swt1 family HEPN domain-containing protein n=1 Tax=Actinacidiphila soli TaxID=2487275 RepID=UPI000FCC4AF3|nr:Swt1 family HEPN domain-containing protein [Actinacidiphila soli]